MKKKQATMLLTAFLTLGSTVPVMASSVTNTTTSMPTFSYNNTSTFQDMVKESNDKVLKELQERKDMLQETIYADTFKELSLGEKMVLVESYFTVRSDIHKENQKTVLSVTDILELERLEVLLTNESDSQNKDSALIFGLVQEIKSKDMFSLKPEEITAMQEHTEKLMTSYKDMRTAGRNLDTLINTQIKVFHSSQLLVLNKFGTKAELEGDKIQALELGKKVLKLPDGDKESYKKVTNLLSSENKSFFFVDKEAVELSIPLLTKNGGSYADISDISKVNGFEITNDEKKLTVKNNGNVIEVNKEDQTTTFNGTLIGKNFTLLEEGKLYLPVHSTFELFHYDVKWDKEIKNIVIDKQVYEKNELDIVSVADMVKGLFPVIPIQEVKEKETVKTQVKTEKQEVKTEKTKETTQANTTENVKNN